MTIIKYLHASAKKNIMYVQSLCADKYELSKWREMLPGKSIMGLTLIAVHGKVFK